MDLRAFLIPIEARRTGQGPAHHTCQVVSLEPLLANTHALSPRSRWLPLTLIVGHPQQAVPALNPARRVAKSLTATHPGKSGQAGFGIPEARKLRNQLRGQPVNRFRSRTTSC
jgi:hypothetical protein